MKRTWVILLFVLCAGGALPVYGNDPEQGAAQAVVKMADKFFQKAYFIEAHEDPLRLSDAQLEMLRDLRREVRKRLIRENAEIEVLSIDILETIRENPVDVKAANSALENFYELQRKKSQGLIESYASLKNILNDEQYQKLNRIWRGEPADKPPDEQAGPE